MEQNDNDLQGTGSVALGGLDVRRQIPIKLLSKQTIRSKPAARPQRFTTRLHSKSDGESFSYKPEERFECKSGDAYGNQRRYPQPLFWDYKLHLVGAKDDSPVHFCDKCGLPIKIYGRMIPCKHVFCYDCAAQYEKKSDKMCPGCTDPVQRIEQCHRGSLFMCNIVQGCKRTYLSQRDLQAHINHRHVRASKSGNSRPDPPHPTMASDPPDCFRLPPPPHLPKAHPLIPPPTQGHDAYNQPPPLSPSSPDLGPSQRPLPPETFRIATLTTRKHSNLITVPIHDNSGSSGPTPHEPHPQTPPGPPPHHHPGDYSSQPVVSHPHHIMHLTQQPHYGPPPPPPLSIPMQHPPQGSATPHMVYNQAPPMPLAPLPITSPPGHIMSQMPPYMSHPPHGPIPQHGGPPAPPHHYNLNSMPQDQGTLSPPFSQPGALSPGMWPNLHGPHPPCMQGLPPQGQMPGPHHSDQSRYRTYYQ